MNRKQLNYGIRNSIIRYVTRCSILSTRRAIQIFSQCYSIPKQVVSGNISWLVRSGQLSLVSCKPNSYLY
jgi:hypothetical protein